MDWKVVVLKFWQQGPEILAPKVESCKFGPELSYLHQLCEFVINTVISEAVQCLGQILPPARKCLNQNSLLIRDVNSDLWPVTKQKLESGWTLVGWWRLFLCPAQSIPHRTVL